MQLSKQHYAVGLANQGANVFFLNPARCHFGLSSRFTLTSIGERLFIIESSIPFIPRLRFRLKLMFSLVHRLCLEKYISKKRIEVHIVWNFDNGLVSRVLPFRDADIKIFHPVDYLVAPVKVSPYDYVFSLSQSILNTIGHSHKYFINHGLTSAFETCGEALHSNHLALGRGRRRLVCGYVGNLLAHAIDREVFYDVIQSNPDVEFWLIGTYSYKENNLMLNPNVDDMSRVFVEKIRSLPNVVLFGPLAHDEIVKKFASIDLFLIAYKVSDHYKGDNSHKVLEYLSTGKPIVSSFLSVYSNFDLLIMAPFNRNDLLVDLFKFVASNIDFYMQPQLCERRVRYALENRYESHIKRIEKILF